MHSPLGDHRWMVQTGAAQDVLPAVAARFAQVCTTSPPYWQQRDYKTGRWEGGDPECQHGRHTGRHQAQGATSQRGGRSNVEEQRNESFGRASRPQGKLGGGMGYVDAAQELGQRLDSCPRCGAVRIDRQLGMEPTPEEYVDNLVAILMHVHRALRDDGLLWLNLGNTYAGSGKGAWLKTNVQKETYVPAPGDIPIAGRIPIGWQSKAMIPIDSMVEVAMSRAGWIQRSRLIWWKPNQMPGSQHDRPTTDYEVVQMYSKKGRYFYDEDAIAEQALNTGGNGSFAGRMGGASDRVSDGGIGSEFVPYRDMRTARTVWAINTEPLEDEHYAAYPTELARRCIAASTSEKGHCPKCGAGWKRVVRVNRRKGGKGGPPTRVGDSVRDPGNREDLPKERETAERETLGWEPGCKCGIAETVPAIVLDPFSGSVRTGIAALRLDRRYYGIELNPSYADMGRLKIFGDAPMFTEMAPLKLGFTPVNAEA